MTLKNRYEIRGDTTAIFLRRRNGEILETLISTSDIEKVKTINTTFYAKSDHKSSSNNFYAYGNLYENKTHKTIRLHRFITNCPKDLVVDHINHKTLDNRLSNLRVVTHAQNCQNRKSAMKNNKTGIRGVCWRTRDKKFEAYVHVNGKKVELGYFDDIKEAEETVIKARQKLMPYSREGGKVHENV